MLSPINIKYTYLQISPIQIDLAVGNKSFCLLFYKCCMRTIRLWETLVNNYSYCPRNCLIFPAILLDVPRYHRKRKGVYVSSLLCSFKKPYTI